MCFLSYKLWYNYLKLRRKTVKGRCVTDPAYEDANSAHERALVFMNKVSSVYPADDIHTVNSKMFMCLYAVFVYFMHYVIQALVLFLIGYIY